MGEDRSATEQSPDRRRVTVAEAAEILGITAESSRAHARWRPKKLKKLPRTDKQRVFA